MAGQQQQHQKAIQLYIYILNFEINVFEYIMTFGKLNRSSTARKIQCVVNIL